MNVLNTELSRKGLFAVILSVIVLFAFGARAEEIQSRIAHGGLLYDNWIKLAYGVPGKGDHPSYPETGKAKGKGKGTWRCKECHGWDYRGKDGAYASGSHFSGIKGIGGGAGKSVEAIIAILKDDTHRFTDKMMSADDFEALGLFVSKGQVDMAALIGENKKAKGDKAKGEAYYNTICAKCHGVDGRKIKDMPETIGEVASVNPWEALHKMLNGQPGKEMPALRALPLEVSLDILAHAQTLPQSK